MNKITIECVWSPSRREFNRFVKGVDKSNTRIIDYLAIKKKLVKADPYGEEPSDSIVGFTIINEITRCLRTDKSDITRVIYLFKNLEAEVVKNFKELIVTRSEREVDFKLTIVQRDPFISTEMASTFSDINFIKR